MQTIDVNVYRPRAGTDEDDTAVITVTGEPRLSAMVGLHGQHTGLQGNTAPIQALDRALEHL